MVLPRPSPSVMRGPGTATTLTRISSACYERAVARYRELADRFNEAATLDHLGDTQHSAGDIQAARRTWTSALRIIGEIDHPDGDQVQAKLNRTSRQPDASSAVAAP